MHACKNLYVEARAHVDGEGTTVIRIPYRNKLVWARFAVAVTRTRTCTCLTSSKHAAALWDVQPVWLDCTGARVRLPWRIQGQPPARVIDGERRGAVRMVHAVMIARVGAAPQTSVPRPPCGSGASQLRQHQHRGVRYTCEEADKTSHSSATQELVQVARHHCCIGCTVVV